MTQLEGLKNFCENIQRTMFKIKDGEKLEAHDKNDILQFYLEVVDYLSKT